MESPWPGEHLTVAIWLDRPEAALGAFRRARELAGNTAERRHLDRMIALVGGADPAQGGSGSAR